MEGSGSSSKREGKRRLEEGDDDDYGRGSAPKQQKTPAFDRVMLEALKRDDLEKFSPYLEPLIRKIVGITFEHIRQEMQQCLPNDQGKLEALIRKILHEQQSSALKTDIPNNLTGGLSPPKIQESRGRELQLRIETKMPDHLFAGKKVQGEGGLAILVILIDLSNGSVVKTGPESTAKLNVLVLHGDFDEDFNDGWTHEIFKSHQVEERNGKAPILIGATQVTLKDGVGILGDLTFTDNSSWTRTKKFRLGVELAPGFCEGIHVIEAKTEAFAVLDQRGESYRKHYPPALQDELFRLKGIAKDKPLHKKLLGAGIRTIEDLLRLNAKDPQKLRIVLGKGMTDTIWKSTIEHAKTCDLSGGKCYVFYTDESQSSGVIFNHIHELKGYITDSQVLPLESLAQTKELSYLVKKAHENWHEVIEYDGHVLQSFTTTNHNITYAPINHPYSTPDPILQMQSGNMSEQPQFRLPILNADQTCMGLAFTNPEIGLVGSSMYTKGETSGAGCSNRKDCLQLINGPRLENFLWELTQIMDDDEMEKVSFTNQEVGETSGAGCSYSLEDWYNRPMRESIVDDEMMENTELNFVDDEMMENTGFNLGGGVGDEMGLAAIFSHSNEAHYSYGEEPEPPYDEPSEVDHGMNRGKAAVGWLNIKVALRWGIEGKKRAAERRAQLTELV